MFALSTLAVDVLSGVLSKLVASYIEQAGTKLVRHPDSNDKLALERAFQAGIAAGFQTIVVDAPSQIADRYSQLIERFLKSASVKQQFALLIFPQELQLAQATNVIEVLRDDFRRAQIQDAAQLPIDFDKFIPTVNFSVMGIRTQNQVRQG